MTKSNVSIVVLMGMWISSASAHAVDLNIKVAPQSACYFGDWDLILSDLAADHKANVESSLVMTVEQGDQVSSFRLLGSKDSEAPVNLEFPVSLKSATAPIRISLCKDSSSLQSCKGKRSESFEQMASRYIYTEPQLLLPKSEFEALREARRKLPSPEDRIYFFNVITSSPQERSTSEIEMEAALGNIKAEREGSVVRIKLPYLDKTKCG